MKRIKGISKKVNIYISVFVLLVGAVFSFPMDAKAAKKITYVANENANAVFYMHTSDSSDTWTPGLITIGQTCSGKKINPNYFSNFYFGRKLEFATDEIIPAGSVVSVKATFTFECPYPSNNTFLESAISSPVGTDESYQFSAHYIDPYTCEITYSSTLTLNTATSHFTWSKFYFQFSIGTSESGYTCKLTFDSMEMSYEVDESEKDVLEDIRDNTTETNDKLDNLTDGFQNDGMDSSKDELNSSLAGIDNAENSLFNPAKDHLGSYEFVDINSFQGLATGVTFVSTFLQSFYVSSGGLDGLGIITAVGFSVLLVSVVIGFFRYYKK